MNVIIKNYAPKCAVPSCTNRVGYHSTKPKKNGGTSVKYKMCCDLHRGSKKSEVDNWKMSIGCQNTDAHHGFKCTATIFSPEQLDINHIDGNRTNNDPSNLEVLCKNCHAKVTIQEKHHHNRYTNEVDLSNVELWEF